LVRVATALYFSRDSEAATRRFFDEALLCSVELADDDVVKALTAVAGIGAWTVNVFLIFSLGRLDVMPAGDLGIRPSAIFRRRTGVISAARIFGRKWDQIGIPFDS
jgi:hypothetical protein